MLEQSFGRWHKFSLGAPCIIPPTPPRAWHYSWMTIGPEASRHSFLPCLTNDGEKDGIPLWASWCVFIPVSPKYNHQGRKSSEVPCEPQPPPHPISPRGWNFHGGNVDQRRHPLCFSNPSMLLDRCLLLFSNFYSCLENDWGSVLYLQ